MDFWTSRKAQDDESNDREREPKPTFLQNLTEFVKDEAKDEAVSSVVEYLTDGWITYEGGDDDEEEDQRRRNRRADQGTFEERLQRSLAELGPQGDARVSEPPPAPVEAAAPAPVPVYQSPVAVRPAPVMRPALRGATGFGRKGL
ncbi:MAG: hypothetical protein RSE14_11285 [Erythrobacter sp.]|jgi:hypothetical protein|uniref:hypothetical protein n=1 Tax=Erythrobacter sp. TaxID=1042 RepID=UPI002B473B8F|nr:hypothetical protein [Erythrobacter sp.]WRH69858.1 MAG: hypothetical protein RSE14_11285 [Erythrobacter sp.]